MKKWRFVLYLAVLLAFLVAALVNWIDCNSFGVLADVNGAFFVLVLLELAEISAKVK